MQKAVILTEEEYSEIVVANAKLATKLTEAQLKLESLDPRGSGPTGLQVLNTVQDVLGITTSIRSVIWTKATAVYLKNIDDKVNKKG